MSDAEIFRRKKRPSTILKTLREDAKKVIDQILNFKSANNEKTKCVSHLHSQKLFGYIKELCQESLESNVLPQIEIIIGKYPFVETTEMSDMIKYKEYRKDLALWIGGRINENDTAISDDIKEMGKKVYEILKKCEREKTFATIDELKNEK